MKMPRLTFLLLPLALAGCTNSSVRDTLGLNRVAPDEFVVVSRPPLSVPPEFDLHPPRPGEPARMPSATEEARRQLLGGSEGTAGLGEDASMDGTGVTPVVTADAPSAATANFLKRVGATAADDGIREKLNTDTAQPVKNEEADSLYEQVVGSKKDEPTVDPEKETERLIKNKEEGKPVNEGDVPTQEDKPSSVIDAIF